MKTSTPFNYFQIILDDINEIQASLGEPKNLNLRIIEEKGILTISNGNARNRKLKFADKMPELMTQIFKKLISNYGASIIGISLMLPQTIWWKKYYFPRYLSVNQVYLNKRGEGKLMAKNNQELSRYLKNSSEGGFPFSYSMVVKISINLKSMETAWMIRTVPQ